MKNLVRSIAKSLAEGGSGVSTRFSKDHTTGIDD